MSAVRSVQPQSQSEASQVPRLGIGQVLQRLKTEFPDLSHSKIRFLEDKGLVKPDRSPKGYRKYSDADVIRVRQILTMQRDLYLPLRVIGDYFDELDRGLNPVMPGSQAPQMPSMLVTEVRLDRRELIERAGATAALLDQSISAGLLRAAAWYTETELKLLTTLVELERVGIGPRHLRPFRMAARHEQSLIDQVVAPLSRKRDSLSRERARERAGELADCFNTVRVAMLAQTISEALGEDAL